MSIFNGYMSQAEREIEIFENMNEIYNKKVGLMIEAVETQLETNFLEAECKVMIEGGSYDDLSYLYMEASKDAEEKKKGVFASIKSWITSILNKIRDFFSEKFGKTALDKLPQQTEADGRFAKQYEIFKKIFDILTAPFKKIKEGKLDELTTTDKVVGSVETLLGGLGLGVAINKTVKYAKPKVIEMHDFVMNKLKKTCDDVIEGLEKAESTAKFVGSTAKLLNDGSNQIKQESGEENSNKVEIFSNQVMEWVRKLIKLLTSFSSMIMKWWTEFFSSLRGKKNTEDSSTKALPGEENKKLPAPKKELPSGDDSETQKNESVDLFNIDYELDTFFESLETDSYDTDLDSIYSILEDF